MTTLSDRLPSSIPPLPKRKQKKAKYRNIQERIRDGGGGTSVQSNEEKELENIDLRKNTAFLTTAALRHFSSQGNVENVTDEKQDKAKQQRPHASGFSTNTCFESSPNVLPKPPTRMFEQCKMLDQEANRAYTLK